MFATDFTSTGKPNPAMKSIHDLKLMNTAQNVGIDAAANVRFSGISLQENNFVSRTGQLINGWQLRGSFVSEAKVSDVGSFAVEIFIMDMHDEVDSNGDPTGRLILRVTQLKSRRHLMNVRPQLSRCRKMLVLTLQRERQQTLLLPRQISTVGSKA